MKDKYDIYFSYKDLLDEKHQKELKSKLLEIEDRKEEYNRVYYLQVDNYRMHKTKFDDREGIIPEEYEQMLDHEFAAFAEETYWNQLEEQEERAKEEQEKVDKDIEKDLEKTAEDRYEEFLNEMDFGNYERDMGDYEPEKDMDDREMDRDEY